MKITVGFKYQKMAKLDAYKKLDLWERHFLGDLEATKEVLILCGLAKRSDFDFEQEAWFQPD